MTSKHRSSAWTGSSYESNATDVFIQFYVILKGPVFCYLTKKKLFKRIRSVHFIEYFNLASNSRLLRQFHVLSVLSVSTHHAIKRSLHLDKFNIAGNNLSHESSSGHSVHSQSRYCPRYLTINQTLQAKLVSQHRLIRH
jgi:hypothetical protein